MNDDNNIFDIDDILREYSTKTTAPADEPVSDETQVFSRAAQEPAKPRVRAEERRYESVPELPPDDTPEEPEAVPETAVSAEEAPARSVVSAGSEQEPVRTPKPKRAPKPEKAPSPAPVQPRPEPAEDEPAPKKKRGVLDAVFSLVFAAAGALILVWVLFNIHPASGTVSTAVSDTKLSLNDKIGVFMNNTMSDSFSELTYIRKIYTLQESDTISPVPDPDCYGQTEDPSAILDVIKQAAVLLDGQSVIFDVNSDFVPGVPIRWYLDDTILVIAWQEFINNRCCTCAEVKIAHGSQLRRKLAEDSYSSSVQLYASAMANEANSVVAINGDFYAFRELGITAYQRKLYRNAPQEVDSCFFTASGDMLFSRAGELTGPGEAEQFIADNDVVFAIAFGPVLIDNGELQYCERYPIGEIDTEYSRSCISQYDTLHYFLMTINHTVNGNPRATINELARYIYTKGVQKSYTLDGGQTSEIIMNGAPINHVDFGAERTVSDIIYFATALPNEEGNR